MSDQDGNFKVEISGLDDVILLIGRIPQRVQQYLRAAGREAAKEVIQTEGLQKYPPATAANRPPVPYYQRGEGMHYENYVAKTSEHLGRQWYVADYARFSTEIGNRASYARFVVGPDQAEHMGPNANPPKGWRILQEVVKEKTAAITTIYQAWMDKLLREVWGGRPR